MSADIGLYVNISAMAAAFSADAILSTLLIFLWLMQRKEKHALFWGVGQFAVMAGSMLYFIGKGLLPHEFNFYLFALLLTICMAGFLGGAPFFFFVFWGFFFFLVFSPL